MSDCCSGPGKPPASSPKCPVSGDRGKPVGVITLRSLLAEESLDRLIADHDYYFCSASGCSVVYFSDDPSLVFEKSHLKVRVGQKETRGPIPLCYCFGHTDQSIAEELQLTGTSTVVESITAKVKADACACEINNPQGSCCLGNVIQAVKKAKSLLLTP